MDRRWFRVEIGSMFAYFFFRLYFIVDISHFDLRLSHELHIFSLHDTDNIEKNRHWERMYL